MSRTLINQARQAQWVVVLTAVVSAWAVAGHAATICVKPSGGGCQPTIQAAVTAAAPGDTVLVNPSAPTALAYFEAVTIPPGKDGLILEGASPTNSIIDSYFAGAPTITIQSNNVTVEKLTLRNGYGITVDSGVSGTLISKVQILRTSSYACITINGLNTTIEQSTLAGCGSYGIYWNGSGTSGLTVSKNTIGRTTNACILAYGNGSSIEKNTLTNCGGVGIDLHGDNATATKNTVSTAYGAGISLDGDSPTVDSNKTSATYGTGVTVTCHDVGNTTCTGGLLTGNTVSSTYAGSYGVYVYVYGTSPGIVTVEKNKVSQTGFGFYLYGPKLSIEHNQSLDANSYGFYVQGDNATIDHNVSRRSHGDGFSLYGSNGVFTNNTAQDNLQDGIRLSSGSGDALTSNIAKGNTTSGIHVISSTATLTSNTAKQNGRADFCNTGSSVTTTSNSFTNIDTNSCGSF